MPDKMDTKKDIPKFNEFLNIIRKALSEPLPGVVAHGKMAPPHIPVELRVPKVGDHVRDSAVLILFWLDGDQIATVFILRPEYDGIHSNQIAFPGGKHEKTDIDFVSTALREAQEEVGIIPESITILGQLSPLYIPPSQFLVYPIVGFTTITPTFILDPIEIKEVIPCHLFDFIEQDTYVIRNIEVGGKILPNIPCYKIGERLIWGATAMIFNELLDIIRPKI
jgi:8-oxo-dGTP pyrophosphatase MutT (NUDIX family)